MTRATWGFFLAGVTIALALAGCGELPGEVPPATVTITADDNGTVEFILAPENLVLQMGGGHTLEVVYVQSSAGLCPSSYWWFVNGVPRGGEPALTLDTEDHPSWFTLGANSLTLLVEIDEMSYSAEFTFRVEQYQ